MGGSLRHIIGFGPPSWRVWPRAFLFAICLGTLANLARGAAAQEQEQPYRSTDPGYPYSVYREVAEDVLALGLWPDDSRTFSCEHNYYGANPCLSSISLWRKFADRFQLERNRVSAEIFQAYIRRDYRMGDRLYSEMKGYELPPHGGYEGPGLEVLEFDLDPDSNQEKKCENNPFADFPCKQTAAAWQAFSKKHRLPQNRQGGAIFQAYLNGDFVRGDRLYSALTDRRTQYEVVHSGIGNEVMALNMGFRPRNATLATSILSASIPAMARSASCVTSPRNTVWRLTGPPASLCRPTRMAT